VLLVRFKPASLSYLSHQCTLSNKFKALRKAELSS